MKKLVKRQQQKATLAVQDILSNIGHISEARIQDNLFNIELRSLATSVKYKFPDTGITTSQIEAMLVDEFMGGDRNYKVWNKVRYVHNKEVQQQKELKQIS